MCFQRLSFSHKSAISAHYQQSQQNASVRRRHSIGDSALPRVGQSHGPHQPRGSPSSAFRTVLLHLQPHLFPPLRIVSLPEETSLFLQSPSQGTVVSAHQLLVRLPPTFKNTYHSSVALLRTSQPSVCLLRRLSQHLFASSPLQQTLTKRTCSTAVPLTQLPASATELSLVLHFDPLFSLNFAATHKNFVILNLL